MSCRIYPDLATYFAETGETQKEFAKRLKINEPKLSRIKNGLEEPDLALALEISKEANVPLESLISENHQ